MARAFRTESLNALGCQTSQLERADWVAILDQTIMDRLTFFGLFAVTEMLVCYAMEQRSTWYILAFSVACVLGSVYGFLQGAWPFGLVEAVWSLVALRRWLRTRRRGKA